MKRKTSLNLVLTLAVALMTVLLFAASSSIKRQQLIVENAGSTIEADNDHTATLPDEKDDFSNLVVDTDKKDELESGDGTILPPPPQETPDTNVPDDDTEIKLPFGGGVSDVVPPSGDNSNSHDKTPFSGIITDQGTSNDKDNPFDKDIFEDKDTENTPENKDEELPATPDEELPATPDEELPTTPDEELPTTPDEELPSTPDEDEKEVEIPSEKDDVEEEIPSEKDETEDPSAEETDVTPPSDNDTDEKDSEDGETDDSEDADTDDTDANDEADEIIDLSHLLKVEEEYKNSMADGTGAMLWNLNVSFDGLNATNLLEKHGLHLVYKVNYSTDSSSEWYSFAHTFLEEFESHNATGYLNGYVHSIQFAVVNVDPDDTVMGGYINVELERSNFIATGNVHYNNYYNECA
jgi:hypothetical protein